ncbi:hypothetical protein Ae168Ps1_6194c [Pseudonocardia sp. Ae168_Ps1]|uniref:hypothetical protein n=1 Tax=unclassified Pseudonocardia TaxID=2619320 RepID=UPI000967CA0E|nr:MULTISPECIES: hypothetical protein [unclassified Pseudonocardia]OLL70447.1 hypothetical protein Ae168Ps1_6194c [Pseudonocardia sp. Ae168_Ps1]OLL71566.1 hypothetical protein Ae263Ps1_6054c [Pseudonocardia sp. Ae263_Ps1]
MNDGPPRFEDLLQVIIRHSGGVGKLAQETDVPRATLRAWQQGDHPKQRLTRHVETVESWARRNIGANYPPPGFPMDGLPGFVYQPNTEHRATPDAELGESDEEEGDRAPTPIASRTLALLKARPTLLRVGALAAIAIAALVALLSWNGSPPPTAVTVQNKYATGPQLLLDDLKPAYLSSRTEPFCSQKGCDVADTDLRTGTLVPVDCVDRAGDMMTNADRQSPGIDKNPAVVESRLWYHAVLQNGQEGLLSEVYVIPESRHGLGLPDC